MNMNPPVPHVSHFKRDADSQIKRVPISDLRNDSRFFEQALEILKPIYRDPVAVMLRELDTCNWAYLINNDNALDSFLFVNWASLPLLGEDTPTLYLGLGGSRKKSNDEMKKIYEAVNNDGYRWEISSSLKLIVWATSNESTVPSLINEFFSEIQPASDGGYSDWAANIAKTLRHIYFPHFITSNSRNEESFLLRGVGAGYPQIESETGSLSLYKKLGLDGKRGDRVLFLAHIKPILH